MRAVAQPKPAVARPVSASDVVGKQLGAAGGSVDQSLVKNSPPRRRPQPVTAAETPHPNGYTRAVPGRDLLAAQPLFGRLKGVRQCGLFRSNLQFLVRHVEAENIVPVRGAQNCGIHDYAPFLPLIHTGGSAVEVYACVRSRVDSKWSNGALIRVAPYRKVGLRPQRRPATRSIRCTGSVLDGEVPTWLKLASPTRICSPTPMLRT